MSGGSVKKCGGINGISGYRGEEGRLLIIAEEDVEMLWLLQYIFNFESCFVEFNFLYNGIAILVILGAKVNLILHLFEILSIEYQSCLYFDFKLFTMKSIKTIYCNMLLSLEYWLYILNKM